MSFVQFIIPRPTSNIGYELAIQQKVKYVNDILQALLLARKRVGMEYILQAIVLINDLEMGG
jgi:hypothetical protein